MKKRGEISPIHCRNLAGFVTLVPMKRLLPPFFFLTLVALVGLANILVLDDLTDVRTKDITPSVGPVPAPDFSNRPLVRIGVVSRFAPNVIYTGYQPIMDYLNHEGTRRYELQLSTSYQDAVDHLRLGKVDASFLGSWIFGHLNDDRDLQPLAAPLNSQGRSEFHAVLVTNAASDLTSVSQLSGRKVALPSAQSWSGNWLQENGLSDAGLSVADLDSVHHFDHHQTVVWQVLRGNFDAGVVKESVAEEYRSEGLRTVAISQPIPGSPLVGRRGTDPEILGEIRRLLLALDPARLADRRMLDSWSHEFSFGFTAVDRDQFRNAFPTEGETR